MSNTYGKCLTISIFGESHGAAIGAVLDGIPAGTVIDWDQVRSTMERRAPGRNQMSTSRKETDAFEVVSGYFNDHTTGTPLTVLIRNQNQHSRDYDLLRHVMRPGHADYTGRIRYSGFNDYRGGGHFSGRLTAPLVFAGAVAEQILAQRGVTIGAHIKQIASIQDRPFAPLGEERETLLALKKQVLPVLEEEKVAQMEQAIAEAKASLDSLGGIIECTVVGLPAGLGNPFFDSVESRLSHMLFSVPAVKGLEFGDGFSLAGMHGSQANDPMQYEKNLVKTTANHNGGIIGGITNGMPIIFRTVIKPTASIAQKQQTVDLDTQQDCSIEIKGRHDPCIVQRAVPVIEAAAAWALLDIWMTTQAGR